MILCPPPEYSAFGSVDPRAFLSGGGVARTRSGGGAHVHTGLAPPRGGTHQCGTFVSGADHGEPTGFLIVDDGDFPTGQAARGGNDLFAAHGVAIDVDDRPRLAVVIDDDASAADVAPVGIGNRRSSREGLNH